LVFCIGLIQANIFRDLFSSQTSSGPSFSLRAAEPSKYDHTKGGGSYYEGVSTLDGFYYACGEKASLVLLISTDSSYTGTTSTVFTIDYTAHPALKLKAVVNNCAFAPDSSSPCSGGGVSVATSGGSIQVTKLGKSTRAVVRLDFAIDCSQLSATGPALTITGYKTSAGSVTVSDVSIDFVRPSSVYNCDDGDACTTDAVSGCVNSRTCTYTRKNCDDGNTCTIDSCDAATGTCAYTPKSCDDNVGCTTDSCDAQKGCIHTVQNFAIKMLVPSILVILLLAVFILLLSVMITMLVPLKPAILRLDVLLLLFAVVIKMNVQPTLAILK